MFNTDVSVTLHGFHVLLLTRVITDHYVTLHTKHVVHFVTSCRIIVLLRMYVVKNRRCCYTCYTRGNLLLPCLWREWERMWLEQEVRRTRYFWLMSTRGILNHFTRHPNLWYIRVEKGLVYCDCVLMNVWKLMTWKSQINTKYMINLSICMMMSCLSVDEKNR